MNENKHGRRMATGSVKLLTAILRYCAFGPDPEV